MRHLFSLVIPLLYFTTTSVAQNKTFTLSLYYAINEVTSLENLKKVDSLLIALETSTSTINIYGYADYLSTDVYNLTLSQRRADVIKNYLLKKKTDQFISIQVCKGLGEKNSEEKQGADGESMQRRVDLVINQRSSFKKIGTRDNKIQEEKRIEDLKKGESLAIEGLSFIPGRHVVTESALPVMKRLLQTLKENPELNIEIQGHVCCPGDGQIDGMDFDTHEYKLSENRAKAIYDFLIKNGIEEERLTYKGYGRSHPKVEVEKSPEDEQMNRRVEIKIIEK